MESGKSRRRLTDWRLGDHLCFFYETEEEHLTVLTSFLRHGLEHGEKVIYLLEHHVPETILKYLENEGFYPEPYLAQGQLFFRSAREIFLRQGRFEPEPLLSLWQQEVEKALAEGFRGLRVTGEMTWALQPVAGVDRLIEYESRLNDVPGAENFLALCQYDRRRFDSLLLMEVLAAHERIVIGTEVLDNIYYLPFKGWSDKAGAAARLEGWLNALAERQRTLEAREQEFRLVNQHLWCEIEKRGQIEDRLRESEARFAAFMQHLPGAAVVRDLDGRYLFANESWEKAFGKGKADWEGKTLEEIWPAAMAAHMREVDQQVIASRRPVESVLNFTLENGSRAWLINRFPILDQEGQPVMVGAVGIDITARRTAEEALYREKEKYQTLAENSPLGLSIISRDGRYLYLNPKFVKIFGYTLEDIPTGREWFAKAYPDPAYRHLVIADWKEEAKKPPVGEISPRTFRVRCKDGAVKMINFRSAVLPSGDWMMFYEDITERLQAQEALAESQEQYRLLVNQIPAVVFRGYADWSISCFDRKIEAVTGYAKEDFDERRVKWSDLIPPEEMDYVRGTFVEALKTNKSYVREHRIRKKDGGYAWVHCRGRIFCDPEGRIEYISGVTFDITKHKEAEAALRESEKRYRLLAENVSDVIWTADLNLRLTYISPSVKLLRGFTPEEVLSQGLEDILTPDSLKLARKTFAEGMALEKRSPEPGKSWDLELEQYRKDGSTVWTEVRASFLRDESGRPVGILGISRDISRRKEAEEALRASKKKLRSLANQLLGAQENERKRLAAELHDELGHSLLTLKLRLKSLEKQLLPQQQALKKDLKQILKDVGDTIENVRRLYLDLSPGDLEDLGLTGALRSMIDNFNEVNPGIIWSVRLDHLDDLFPPPIQTAIYRIVQEALTNTGKHAKARHISLAAAREDHGVFFTIEDDGKGFDREQVLATKKTLGLLAMEERVKILGGSLELFSRKGRGTRISFTIPVPAEREKDEAL